MWPFTKKKKAIDSSRVLEAGLVKLRPLLEGHGFSDGASDSGIAHGEYATKCFRRGDIELGLIVRGTEIGCPNYSIGDCHVGHDNLLAELGAADAAQLVSLGFVSWGARNGGDQFDSLAADLRELILPVLVRSEDDFRNAIAQARKKLQAQRGF